MVHFRVLGLTLSLLLTGCQAPTPDRVMEDPAATVLSPPRGISRDLPPDFYSVVEGETREVVEGYLAATDLITANGGRDSAAIVPLVSESWLVRERAGFQFYETEGLRSVGATSIHSLIIQSAHLTRTASVEVGALMCVEGTDLFVFPEGYEDPPEVVWQWHPAYEDFVGDDSEWDQIEEYLSQPGVTWGNSLAVQAWLVGETTDSLVVDSWEPWWGVYEC